jgi:hypothetical protein
MSSSESREALRQSWRDLYSCTKQVCASEVKRLAVLLDRLLSVALVTVACAGVVAIIYVIVWFISNVCLHDLLSIPALSGEQCVGVTFVWAFVLAATCLWLFAYGVKPRVASGHHDVVRREWWIIYQDAVEAVEDALLQLDVGGMQGHIAKQMLSPLLEGPTPDKSGEISYLDAVLAIADELHDLNVETYGHDYEEMAEKMLSGLATRTAR